MTKIKSLLSTSVAVLLVAGTIGLTGCGGVSEEQLAQLDALRSEVSSLEKEVNSLKSEKTKLERELAEKQSKLEQCANDKAATKKNLEKFGM